MNKNCLTKREILEGIRTKKISSQEGLRLIKSLQQRCEKMAVSTESGKEDWSDIAVVGAAGRFPGASDLQIFWDNLMEGKNCIEEIPETRWEINKCIPQVSSSMDKIVCRKGGFLSDIDRFDCFFFNISPKEAELIDPQQRLFLEESFKALESAGLSNTTIKGKKCTIYFGCNAGDYSVILRGEDNLEAFSFMGNAASILPARLSYFLDLKGATISLDTACSSSLVAIHLGCEAIMGGSCEISIAGGVNVMSTLEFYVLASSAGMLSPEGKCKTFDNSADGFVPGEGVGVVVLKSLDRALSDRNNILGVIKGSVMNQDGKTNGITAPNGLAQSSLECELYDRFGIDPETISYIETHGTGTRLGDPIEVNALKETFKKYTDKKKFCALGSVKSNIGHTLASAGVAGFIKVLLAFKHKKIPPAVHFEKPNKLIDFENSPFYVNTSVMEWQPADRTPRRAAISSFGFSGTNVHMILDEPPEYPENKKEAAWPYYFIPLSAKSETAFVNRVSELLHWLEENSKKYCPGEIAYNLCLGRSHFFIRGGCIVKDMDELKAILKQVTGKGIGKSEGKLFFKNNLKTNPAGPDEVSPELSKKIIAELHELEPGAATAFREKMVELAVLYKKGSPIDWNDLFKNQSYRFIDLPLYPFDDLRSWVAMTKGKAENNGCRAAVASRLHPLLEKNTSNLHECSYTTSLSGSESYIADYLKDGLKLFPEVLYLEMARVAGEMSDRSAVVGIKNNIWSEPVTFNGKSRTIKLRLFPADDHVGYEIYSLNDEEISRIHAQGELVIAAPDSKEGGEEYIDIQAARSACEKTMRGGDCYNLLNALGVFYGDSFRPIRELASSGNHILVKLESNGDYDVPDNRYRLLPSFMEGVFQAILVCENSSDLIPAGMGEINIIDPPGCSGYAYIIPSLTRPEDGAGRKYEVRLLDDSGKVQVRIADLRFMKYDAATDGPTEGSAITPEKAPAASENVSRHLLVKSWRESKSNSTGKERLDGALVWLVNDETEGWVDRISKKLNAPEQVVIRHTKGGAGMAGICHQLDFHDEECCLEGIREIMAQTGKVAGLVDLSDVKADPMSEADVRYGKIVVLRELLKGVVEDRDLSRFFILHLSRGLQLFETEEPTLAGADFAGFVKNLSAEYGKVTAKTVDIDNSMEDMENISEIVERELFSNAGTGEILYRGNRRFVPYLTNMHTEVTGKDSAVAGLKVDPRKVIVITGGTGGIGIELARHFIAGGNRKLLLMGVREIPRRSEWESIAANPKTDRKLAEKIDRLLSLEQEGGEFDVYTGDLSDYKRLNEFIEKTRTWLGEIGGIIHCAGAFDFENPAFIRKDINNMRRVLTPKTTGLVNLYRVFSAQDLDFFILFSSVSSIIPSLAPGTIDYAAANGFMDYFAGYLFSTGKTFFRSINWPNWKEVGVGEIDSRIYRNLGFIAHSTLEGLEALEEIFTSRSTPQVFPCWMLEENEDFQGLLEVRVKNGGRQEPAKSRLGHQAVVDQDLVSFTRDSLREIMARELKMPPEKFDENTDFGDFGVDSIMLAQLVTRIEAWLGDRCEPSIFIEYPTLSSLSCHIAEKYSRRIDAKIAVTSGGENPGMAVEKSYASRKIETLRRVKLTSFAGRHSHRIASPAVVQPVKDNRIAVIGVACQFPGAEDKEQFWNNLVAGIDCVTEVPASRWDIDKYYSHEYESGKTISKWGGFIKDIEYFDAGYFNIREEDAPGVDPLIRKFLETSVQAIQDSGYKREELSNKKVGVFVGSRMSDYKSRITNKTKNSILGIGQNFISSTISHFLNLKGPNLVIDSACSSSLVSIHLACQSLLSGDSEMALAGGVDILLDEIQYLTLSATKALSPDGRCHTFDEEANGIVPGEGCGAILLKPLSRAIEEGDRIYSVIEGTALNNDGRTMGVTTPNPVAQEEVVEEAIRKAGVSPESISLIEAHGTGTMIGDPIELKALTKVFRKYTQQKQFCGVGSVKSNIGHLFSAAGIASFIKVVLSLYYGKLVPTIHCEKPNHRFEFESSPFFPVLKALAWRHPSGVRRAGISSFGFGGTNAHVIVGGRTPELPENYKPRRVSLPPVKFNKKRYWLDKTNGHDRAIEIDTLPFDPISPNFESFQPEQRLPHFLQIRKVQ